MLPEDRARSPARVEDDHERDGGIELGHGLRATSVREPGGGRRREGEDLTQSEILDDDEDDDDARCLGRPPSPELHTDQYT